MDVDRSAPGVVRARRRARRLGTGGALVCVRPRRLSALLRPDRAADAGRGVDRGAGDRGPPDVQVAPPQHRRVRRALRRARVPRAGVGVVRAARRRRDVAGGYPRRGHLLDPVAERARRRRRDPRFRPRHPRAAGRVAVRGTDARGPARLARPLLDLPVEAVLPTHGNPVVEGGRNALAGALES